jgi:signal transduction histidine kinase
VLGVLVVLHDVTDQHECRRRLEDKNDQLDEFISVVSHDLRNPLSVASGNVEIARQETNDQRLDTVADALDRMEGLVEETLQRARHDEDSLEPEPVPLSSLATESWEMVATDSDTRLEAETDLVIEADPEQVRTLLENLFRNAIEHNEEPLAVCVGSIGGTESQRDDVGFFIEDNGKGIPPEKRDRLFEHGFSTRADGTGFGLSIVADVIGAHGWDIRVSESDTGGARFEITGVESAPRRLSQR